MQTSHDKSSTSAVRTVDVPILPVRGSVLLPNALVPLHVGRPASMKAVDAAVERYDGQLAVIAQVDPDKLEPQGADLHRVGTLARVQRRMHLPTEQGAMLVVVEGVRRARLLGTLSDDPFLFGRMLPLDPEAVMAEDAAEVKALVQNVRTLFREIVEASPTLPEELLPIEEAIDDAGYLSDWMAASPVPLRAEVRQWILETPSVKGRLRLLVEDLARAGEDQRLQLKIRNEVQDKITEAQRRMMLQEQLRAIQRELGEIDDDRKRVEELRERVERTGMPEEARAHAERELRRLHAMSPDAGEASVLRTYLELLADLPWSRRSAKEIDLVRAREILDEDHFDLEQVKERILEHLAVQRLKPDQQGPVLCLVGPPGVGKTSLGRSVARATGREFVRLSLGGIHDEAEIRGHRRTYVGALPGQIIQALKRAGTRDPVMMLDEVDKVGRDFRGDPSAALLEVLDPEQNCAFRDNYVEVPFDLSRVLFITTANLLDPIPDPLKDRMETIDLAGYVDEEKLEIARRYLVPRQLERCGIQAGQLAFDDEALTVLIAGYTREAGVRNLEQQIGAICRKRARQVVEGAQDHLVVTPRVVKTFLGGERHKPLTELVERTRRPGVAVALAYTPAGGEILFVEAARLVGGKGGFRVTGQVKDVMRESADAAYSWVRAHARRLAIPLETFTESDLHVHVPAGAIPKDGPSAGVVMVVALVSLLKGRTVRARVALTGEITLSGEVLPVGGIKEKVLAARRHGIIEVVMPADNRTDVEEKIPAHLREGLTFTYVRGIEEALVRAFPGYGRPRVGDEHDNGQNGKRPAGGTDTPVAARESSPSEEQDRALGLRRR